MKITTPYGEIEVTDIPNEGNLVAVIVNLQDQNVELNYKGFIPAWMMNQGVSVEAMPSADSATMRYDGELDDPDHPRPPQVTVIPPR